jgi:2-polyprenyl-3-methyl-5-hydroxy-6-metoxy-1,4-benzoquinol methylase
MERDPLSKAWNWADIPAADWMDVSDEFFPVAHRWRTLAKDTVLDLGCGRGRHALFLAELGFSVTAVDLSADGIQQLKAEATRRGIAGKIEAFVCDMTSWSFSSERFDCVLAFHSIYHTTFDQLRVLVAKVARTLKDSGEFFATFNSKKNPSFQRASNERLDEHTVIKTSGIEAGIPHTYLDHEDISELLSDFTVKKLQEIHDYYDGGVSVHYFVEAGKR